MKSLLNKLVSSNTISANSKNSKTLAIIEIIWGIMLIIIPKINMGIIRDIIIELIWIIIAIILKNNNQRN